MTRAIGAIVLAVTWCCAAARAQAPSQPSSQLQAQTPSQPGAQPQGALSYGTVDRATVRVFAVHGVTSERVRSRSGVDRLLAVPEAAHGSGLLISEDGVVLTAHHVIEDARLLAVWVPGESRAYPASLVYADGKLYVFYSGRGEDAIGVAEAFIE